MRFCARAVPSLASTSLNMGIKLKEKVPSPRTRRKKFGNLKAAVHASVTVRSKKAAIAISRKRPKMRLVNVLRAIKIDFFRRF